jgi:hypothetical protein
MTEQFNVYFAGKVQEGHAPEDVRQAVGKLFKADEPTLDKLFSGKPQIIKKSCDHATAQKYLQALTQVGAQALIKQVPPPEPKAPLTRAERIAAIAAGDDESTATAVDQADVEPAPDIAGLNLAATGADLLRPEERPEDVIANIDISGVQLSDADQPLAEARPKAPPPPATDHLSTAEPGELIPNLARQQDLIEPDISKIDLSPEGTDLSDCNPPPATTPEIALDHIELAVTGSDLLSEQDRVKPAPPPPPNTDHLSVKDGS